MMASTLSIVPGLPNVGNWLQIPEEKHWISDPNEDAKALCPKYELMFWENGSLFIPLPNNLKFDETGNVRRFDNIPHPGEEEGASAEALAALTIIKQLDVERAMSLAAADVYYTLVVHRYTERDDGFLDRHYGKCERLPIMKRVRGTIKLLVMRMKWKNTWDTDARWSAKDLKSQREQLIAIFKWLVPFCRTLFEVEVKVGINVGAGALTQMINHVLAWWSGTKVGRDEETGKYRLIDDTLVKSI